MPILTRLGCIGKVLRCDININVLNNDEASVVSRLLCVSSLVPTGCPPTRKDVRPSPCEGRDGESLTR